MELKTPLYDCHLKANGRIIPFAGYLLPVQYETGVIREHIAVRTHAGLFDVSHMGEILIYGKDALANLQKLLTNDFSTLKDGHMRYTLMCNPQGGILDDLIVYRYHADKYLLVVNAANRHKDADWIRKHLTDDVTMEDLSDRTAQLALQGPNSETILRRLAAPEQIPSTPYTFRDSVQVGGISCLVSNSGYTGENGYEIYCNPKDACGLWEALLEAGKDDGLIPCGLGARDTLRLEAAMPLYGHEMDSSVTPFEAGLAAYVKMQKDYFIGKKALQEKSTPQRLRVGLRMIDRGIARENCVVFYHDTEIGITTSGTHCPFLDHAVAMARIDREYNVVGTRLFVDVRGRKIEAEVVALPFYRKPAKQQ